MYSLLTLALVPAALAQVTSYGCYTESTPPHALSGLVSYDYTGMTQAQCATICTAANYTLWGIEYSGECYCGDSLAAGAIPTFADQCDMLCPGDNSTICGGNGRLSLFGSSATPPAVTDTPHAPVTAATALGCYTEGNGTRALGGDFISDPSMTIEACGSYCIQRGFTYFGVEYARECYCGTSKGPSSLAAPPTDCSMACAGDATETCGGPSRLSVYQWQ